jgi:membrane-associated protease RseP (regulator of RpoE activity)
LAYIALKYLVHGQILPAPDGSDVQLHPIAFAAWVGLLITMINLIPIGQLDGGHISAAYFGGKHERFSGLLHWALLIVGAIVAGWLALDAMSVGMPFDEALRYGFWSALPWLVWAGLLLLMRRLSGGIYHPPVSEEELTPGRKRLALVMLVVFLLIFTPVPLREAIAP